jgi:hypothetical protein
LIDTIADFGSVVGASVGKDYNLLNSRVEKFLRAYMTERVDMINATTREAVQKALESDDPQAAVRHVFEVARDSRAKMIALTEAVRASNWAAVDAGKWVGALDYKRFVSLMDGHERHTHHSMNNQIQPWNSDFVSPSGAHGPVPGMFGVPDEDIACRCAVLPARVAQTRELGDYGDAVQLYEDVRSPHVQALEAAWREVFSEQEAAILAAIG